MSFLAVALCVLGPIVAWRVPSVRHAAEWLVVQSGGWGT